MLVTNRQLLAHVTVFMLVMAAMFGSGALKAQDAVPTPAVRSTDGNSPLSGLRTKFGGSVAATWMGMEPSSTNANPVLTNRRATPEEGFNGEFAAFGSFSMPEADGIASKVKVNIRACYSCHGLELECAFFSFSANSHVSIRAGRFALPIGGINGRHDQSVRIAVSKPLPQIMGGMIRGREFNQGVIPAPMVDNGIGISGDIEVGDFQIAYDFFVVSGLKASGTADLSFVQSRDFEDNNAEPAAGGRLSVDNDWMTLGAAGMVGNSDAGGRNTYQVMTVDITLNFDQLRFDFLYAQRRTEYDLAGGAEGHFWKRGYWAQLSYPLTEDLTVAVSGDGLFVSDMTLGAFGPTTFPGALTDGSNQLNRATFGLAWSLGSGVQAKGGIEYWDFSDFKDAVAYQLGLVWAF